jgi:alpha-glucosidase
MGISGYSLVGDDIGGFGSSPPADLLTRWFEVGAFNPIFRNHAAKGTADHEPWASGPEQEAIRRKYIELRYKLLPYIYTITEETTRNGMPLMRPVFLEYPHAEEFYGDDHDFLFGPDLFVSPVVTESTDAQGVALPPGEWFDFWTSEKHTNKEQINLHPRMEEVPLYVRAGAIVTMQPLVQNTGEKPDGPLELRVYLPSNTSGNECRGTLYQDDGHTFAYQKGEILRVNYSCQASADLAIVTSTVERKAFQPWWKSAEVKLYGVAASPKEVRVGAEVDRDWRFDSQTHSVTLTVPDAVNNWSIRIAY